MLFKNVEVAATDRQPTIKFESLLPVHEPEG